MMQDIEAVKKTNELIVANIRALCLSRNMKVSELETMLKFGNGAIGKWKNAKKVAPLERVEAIAIFFGVSADDLMGRKIVAKNYMPLPTVAEDSVQFPVIGGVAAGYERIAYEDWTGDSIEIPRSYLHGREPQEYFVLRVSGDSMYPDYKDGDHVLVLRQSTMVRSGQVGVVIYGDEAGTLKRVEYTMGEDWMTLRTINPQYPPITIRDEALEHCRVLGVAKLLIRELEA